MRKLWLRAPISATLPLRAGMLIKVTGFFDVKKQTGETMITHVPSPHNEEDAKKYGGSKGALYQDYQGVWCVKPGAMFRAIAVPELNAEEADTDAMNGGGLKVSHIARPWHSPVLSGFASRRVEVARRRT